MNRRLEGGVRKGQRGAVLVLVAVAMLALLAMAGLALDGGHLLLNKTRLQNAVDAAALSAARTIADYPKDTAVATLHAAAEASALAAFLSNLGLEDNGELNDAYAGGGTPLQVQFSTTLNPFVDSATALPYVRVIAQDLPLDVWFLQVVGYTDKQVSASAVAGPIVLNANTCDILPILACGCDSGGTHTPDNPDDDCGSDTYFGYPDNDDNDIDSLADLSAIKLAGGSGSDVGPGNFRLLRLDGTGGSVLRNALAGVGDSCADFGDDSAASTQPGNLSGPVREGLNTRLGIYRGEAIDPAEAPADPVTTFDDNRLVLVGLDEQGVPIINRKEGDPTSIDGLFDYADYLASPEYAGGCTEGEACRRRELVLPIGDCTGSTSGTSEDVHVYSVGCFFLMQDVQEGSDAEVFGQFFTESEGCDAIGTFTSTPTPDPGPFKIVLFRDTDSGDS